MELVQVSTIVRGMDDGYLNIVAGLITILASLLEILALGDIVLNCADMWDVPTIFFSLIFSMAFVGMIMSMLLLVLDAVKMMCLERWGIILMSTVNKRRRHYSENNNGGGTYTHELLVLYEVEASNWSCCDLLDIMRWPQLQQTLQQNTVSMSMWGDQYN